VELVSLPGLDAAQGLSLLDVSEITLDGGDDVIVLFHHSDEIKLTSGCLHEDC
jgi:hypothetical protein